MRSIAIVKLRWLNFRVVRHSLTHCRWVFFYITIFLTYQPRLSQQFHFGYFSPWLAVFYIQLSHYFRPMTSISAWVECPTSSLGFLLFFFCCCCASQVDVGLHYSSSIAIMPKSGQESGVVQAGAGEKAVTSRCRSGRPIRHHATGTKGSWRHCGTGGTASGTGGSVVAKWVSKVGSILWKVAGTSE